jgi:gluconolactonase
MPDVTTLATGLQFPEGPIAMPDGSILLVEIKRRTITRVVPGSEPEVVVQLDGGPNGIAIGPDGACYVANNGGCFGWHDVMGLTLPGAFKPALYSGGRIERVDLATGEVTTLYTECDGRPLLAPNDLVFDVDGGFWFTDHGTRDGRHADRTGIYYATPDGSSITEVIHPIDAPNGVGLSPAGDRLYAAETHTGRVWSWPLAGAGRLAESDATPAGPPRGTLVAGLPGMQLLDSLAIDADGNICVATIINGGITVISPDGSSIEHVPLPDTLTTNICFGGDDLTTAYITCSSTGKLVSLPWPRPGLRLSF